MAQLFWGRYDLETKLYFYLGLQQSVKQIL